MRTCVGIVLEMLAVIPLAHPAHAELRAWHADLFLELPEDSGRHRRAVAVILGKHFREESELKTKVLKIWHGEAR